MAVTFIQRIAAAGRLLVNGLRAIEAGYGLVTSVGDTPLSGGDGEEGAIAEGEYAVFAVDTDVIATREYADSAAATAATSATGGWLVTAVKDADYTAAAGELVRVDATSAPVTVTIPTSAPGNKGKRIAVKEVGGGVELITVVPVAGTIDGGADRTAAAAKVACVLVSDGEGGWVVESQKGSWF
jgi:hypothetical protein